MEDNDRVDIDDYYATPNLDDTNLDNEEVHIRIDISSSEHSYSDDENHSNAGIQENGGSKNSGRGHNKPQWSKSGKEKIEFTKDRLCIVPKDAKLSRYLGSLARTYNFVPLSHTDWRSHKDHVVEKMWKVISAKILQELTQLVATRSEETPELWLQSYVIARGFKTGGRVRSYGDVVTPNMVP
ncbi:Uncharacterized protein Adt_35315 [Abeliophyllum distichum]|uniref:Transposase n=1 Tax=Abeliophyllum distichum TaxID=126358 RepID=A0ABD1QHU1_9LAMI